MDVHKTQVFKISENKILSQAEHKNDFIEKEVQKFYEANLSQLIDAEFIATEYKIEGGRLDTFAIDSDYRPCIIEYKRSTSDSVLLQALFYKNYIANNWQKAYVTVLEIKGKEFADNINWQDIRVILVAESFDKWTVASTTFLNGVELYEFAFHGNDTFTQTFINESKSLSKKQMRFNDLLKNDDSMSTEEIPLVGDADYSKALKVRTIGGHIAETNLSKLQKSNTFVKKAFDELVKIINENYENSEFSQHKNYWVYKMEKKFLEVIFHKTELLLQFNLSSAQFAELTENDIEDLSKQGHWGTLKYLFRVANDNDFEKAKKLLDISYKNTVSD